ncbi:MAG: preprotein translocase subunit YajC [Syntrophomonas sp.]
MNTQGWQTVALYFGFFLLIFYLLVVMPRKRQEKKHKKVLDELKRGDKVVTIGGIKGEISKLGDDTMTLKVSDNTEIVFVRKALAYKEED